MLVVMVMCGQIVEMVAGVEPGLLFSGGAGW
jgi:hypothetical protein